MAQGKSIAARAGALLAAAVVTLTAAAGFACAEAPRAHARHDAHAAAPKGLPANTPGFPDIKGGDFRLLDGQGHARTAKDPDGRPQLLFFGYANCQAICSVALPRMAAAIDALEREGIIATPVLITVDPARDTVATLEPALRKHHPRFVGLTGSDAALTAAYRAFQVERKVVFTHPDYGDVYAHGSYIFLLAADGTFLTLLPPVLGPDRIAEVARGYLE